ncbi:transposase [Devosia ureilytica]|uniref:transposase n=1 Tax=Devosia ureilytica TaxID=2952754 RepID=UPI002F9340F0
MFAYLSRYTHRVAISNSRLLRFDGSAITFRYEDCRRSGANRQQVMTSAVDEFIRRFLIHILPRGFHRIRHYGLLAGSSCKDALAHARDLLEVAPAPDEAAAEKTADQRPPCPCCGGTMVIIETFAAWCQSRAPSSARPSTRETIHEPPAPPLPRSGFIHGAHLRLREKNTSQHKSWPSLTRERARLAPNDPKGGHRASLE